MSALRLVPPDGADWTIDAVATPDGIALVIGFALNGEAATLQLGMNRPDARKLSDGILTAAGDAMQRTFPRPPLPEAVDV